MEEDTVGFEAGSVELFAGSKPVFLARLAGERQLVQRRRAAATAALVLLQEGRFPTAGRLQEQVLLLVGRCDERLGWLEGLGGMADISID